MPKAIFNEISFSTAPSSYWYLQHYDLPGMLKVRVLCSLGAYLLNFSSGPIGLM